MSYQLILRFIQSRVARQNCYPEASYTLLVMPLGQEQMARVVVTVIVAAMAIIMTVQLMELESLAMAAAAAAAAVVTAVWSLNLWIQSRYQLIPTESILALVMRKMLMISSFNLDILRSAAYAIECC